METLVSSITQAVVLTIVLIGGRAIVRRFNGWSSAQRARKARDRAAQAAQDALG
jgi:hypothetical protein